jgi:hypothetical protein
VGLAFFWKVRDDELVVRSAGSPGEAIGKFAYGSPRVTPSVETTIDFRAWK